jgi:uncharacterized lipoprotein YddW (UPF0748 family)
LLPFSFWVAPVLALSGIIGVVKSPENSQQWQEITTRLQSIGVNYCILEQSSWNQNSNLNNVRILFLPNVENINGSQVKSLAQWMNQGGQVIVTGPTGTLSQPEVRKQLKSLFGAYWGFFNSTAATLDPVETVTPLGNNPNQELSSTLVGGVVIPADVNSQIAAVWVSDNSPPAVVMTDKSTFLGWRWGENQVASVNLDIAWLETALKRYGLNPASQISLISTSEPPPCSPNSTTDEPTIPILPQWNQQSSQPQRQNRIVSNSSPTNSSILLANRQDQSFRIPDSSPINPGGLSAQDVQEMTKELEDLIARFASTLLAAEANNTNLNLSTDKVIETSLKYRGTGNNFTNSVSQRSYTAIIEAREGLQTFQKLVQNQRYDEARQLWLRARRNLWDNYPTERQFAQAEIRSMWLDRGTIVQARSEAELAQIFDRMAEAGINVVFFETINASYPIYPSRIAPEQNPLTKGWDPLKAAVKLAHERGMELHAWVWIFAAANQRHNEILGLPSDYLGPVLSRNPDWAITQKNGSPFDFSQGYKKAFFDPANPQVQQYLLSLLEEIVINYDVDGVQFDYIRYPFQAPNKQEITGYSKSSRWLFKEMSGVDPIDIKPGDSLWNQWVAFRIRQVDSFVATSSARLKQRKPNLIISAAVFPMERRDRLYRLQQNWEEWGKNDWVDLIFLMTYAMDTGSFEDRVKPLYQQGSAGASLILPGLRLLKVPDPVTIDQMQLVRNMPTSGLALFAAENLTPNLQAILTRTQGSVNPQEQEPLPHRQPFLAAANRYHALQREWSFLLVNNQLVMDEANLKQWGRQVDTLGNTFNQLAQQPTPRNLAAARTALTRFRASFKTWMRQHQRVQPYQVEVWENRLTTLDQLLVYGERLTLRQQARR